jgi:hypothetical protein
MRSSANRTSPLRRLGAAIAVALAIAAWFGAVFVWTSSDRVTTASGFTDVTVQTIQSPDGVEAARTTLLAAVNTFAAARGYDLTASSRERISEGITEALTEAQFPDLMGPAIERAREAYEAAPDGPITIDFSALRPIAVAKVGQVSPDLVKAIPPDADLTVTVQKSDVPGVASTVVGASDTLRILPLWLVLGALVLGGLALLASGNRCYGLPCHRWPHRSPKPAPAATWCSPPRRRRSGTGGSPSSCALPWASPCWLRASTPAGGSPRAAHPPCWAASSRRACCPRRAGRRPRAPPAPVERAP